MFQVFWTQRSLLFGWLFVASNSSTQVSCLRLTSKFQLPLVSSDHYIFCVEDVNTSIIICYLLYILRASKIHLLRQMLRTRVQRGQRNTFIYVYNNAMVEKAWQLSKGWRKSLAIIRSLKTSKRSFAAMVLLFKTLNLAR